MTYGVARAATSPELALYRTPGKNSRFYAAIRGVPRTIYTARVNQSITAWDNLVSVVFDGGSGTLANVLADMTMYIGTTAGARDVGFVRIRGTDATHFYFGQVSDVKIMDNHYLTVVDEYRLLQRHILVSSDIVLMDSAIAYTDQHKYPDPTPIMGPDRVVKMTGASIAVTYDFSQSYVIDGSGIGTKVTACPTALSVTNSTTNTPTVTFDSAGWHAVYLTITAANGKVFRGVRYVYVYNDENMPPRVKVGSISGNVNDGGWSFELEMYRNADLSEIYEGAKVILFSEDYWGDEQEDIGVVPGSEKIEAVGWIASPESNNINPERGAVRFSVQGPAFWMRKVSAYAAGVNFKISDPTQWSEFKNLTVDKGVWHFAHWRSTLTRICDFFPSGDTKYAPEVSSLAEDLWSQLQEMTALKLLARPGFNALGQLFIQVHPNLIPSADRSFATVLDIQRSDYIGQLDFDRVTVPEVSQVNMSGLAVDAGGNGLAYFAVAPGHTFNHYGIPQIIDKLLTESQTDIVEKASLYLPWRNNPFPSIPILLKANIRLIDLFPNQKCTITIDAADNVRGIAYSGGLLPLLITVNFDDTTGRATREVDFEGQTVEGLAVVEIVEGSGDMTTLPDFSYPDLPSFVPSLPGPIVPSPEGPGKVIAHDNFSAGLIKCDNFSADANEQEWYSINGGLTSTQYLAINKIVVCPNGAVYVGNTLDGADTFIARAPYAGGVFTIIEDATSILAKFGGGSDPQANCFACNPLASEQVAYAIKVGGSSVKTFIGAGTSFTAGATWSDTFGEASISYGFGVWRVTADGKARIFPPDMSSITSTISLGGTPAVLSKHFPISTTDRVIMVNDGDFLLAEDNFGTLTHNVGASSGIPSNLYTVEDGVTPDPAGVVVMAQGSSNGLKSTDGCSSWSTIGNLPSGVGLRHFFAYGGEAGKWIAVSNGGYIYYTDDAWVSAPKDCRGNLLQISATPHIDAVKVLSF